VTNRPSSFVFGPMFWTWAGNINICWITCTICRLI
jgi:hypothetical protein